MRFPELYIKELIDKLIFLEKRFYGECLLGRMYPKQEDDLQRQIIDVKEELKEVLTRMGDLH